MTDRLTEPVAATLSDLTPDPRNARKHTPRNVGAIVDALREVGAARSIVVDETGTILAGNATVQAAAQAGLTRLQIIDTDGDTLVAVRRSNLTAAQKTRLALFDNRAAELAEWDTDALAAILAENDHALAGLFDRDELDDVLGDLAGGGAPAEDPGAQVDRAEELRVKWGTERGQLWLIGRHRLLCGDATSSEDVARLMDGHRAVLMMTDPPYGVSNDLEWRGGMGLNPMGANRKGKVAGDDGADWTEAWRLAPVDVAYVWHASAFADVVMASLRASGFEVRQQIIWRKSIPIISRSAYNWQHEPCWYAVRKNRTAEWRGGFAQTTVWDAPSPNHIMSDSADERTEHPTQKPVALFATAIVNHTEPGDIVYEPFAGSGSQYVAAHQDGRVCYGLDIEPAYVAVTLERLAGMGLAPQLAD